MDRCRCDRVRRGITILGQTPSSPHALSKTVEQRLTTISDVGQTATNSRPELFAAAIDMTLQHPISGVGLNQFAEHSALFGGLTERGQPHETAHNVYLSLSAETGLIGASAFLCFLALIAQRALVALRHRHPLARAVAFGCAASLFGFAIQGMTVSLNRNNLLWATFSSSQDS